MSNIYRSEDMTSCQIFFQIDVVFACLSEIGELGLVQFEELNKCLNAFQRKYVMEVHRCDAMERKLRYLEMESKLTGLPQQFINNYINTPSPRELSYIEGKLDLLEAEVRNTKEVLSSLKKKKMGLIELKHVLRQVHEFYEEAQMPETNANYQTDEEADLLEQGMLSKMAVKQQAEMASLKLSLTTGVLTQAKIAVFERVLWRACHGTILLRYYQVNEPLFDPVTGTELKKVVFIVFHQGEYLKKRVLKICEGFGADLYPCSESKIARWKESMNVINMIQDLHIVITKTEEHVNKVLNAAAKAIPKWYVQVRKAKSIYHIMNKFLYDVTSNCLIAECWIPKIDIETVVHAMKKATDISGSNIPPILNKFKTNVSPPTFNRANKFTHGFQVLVDSYGVASYQEMNPAVFTIITFPFLFSIMFGDIGHGIIMAFLGVALILTENKYKPKPGDELSKIFFGGRYIISLMGIYSIYAGFIYNDIFSKTLNLFGASWKVNYNLSTVFQNIKSLQLDPKDEVVFSDPYYFGIDPAWNLAENNITFLNSFKMKLSILLGVIHMALGIIISQRNFSYLKKRISIWFEFLPHLTFLLCIFGYLSFLFVFKWIFYGARQIEKRRPNCAPSILIRFIDMLLLKKHSVPPPCESNMFPGQSYIENLLLVTAMICVPWMLFGKPLAIIARHRSKEIKKLTASADKLRPDVDVAISVQSESFGRGAELSGEETSAVSSEAQSERAQESHVADESVEPLTKEVMVEPYEEEESVDSSEAEDDYSSWDELGEMFIHQAIHTIEFVLGTVSHTASYLRLWALSLAHQQLSHVLWTMVLGKALSTFEEPIARGFINGLLLATAFAFWALLTVSVLVVMEGMSAFLHTLRLHWVEFQSKFYHGLGYRFVPFSFAVILEALETERVELVLG